MRALGDRARPRDLYDVVNLFRHGDMRPEAKAIAGILAKKCAFKGLDVPTLAALEKHREELQGDWGSMLGHQLPSLPPVGVFWDELPAVFTWMDSGQEPARLAAVPLAEGDIVVRAPAGGLVIPGIASTQPLEIIRFAASNRLCVELDYTAEDGRRSSRVIEPYSLRRTQAGDVILHAVRADSGASRSYRVDRIRGAKATERAFAPRYEIELVPGAFMPAGIPQATRPMRVAAPQRFGPRPRATAFRSGPVHVYECPLCSKRFERKTHDSALRPHKDKNGLPCGGRHGMYVDTR